VTVFSSNYALYGDMSRRMMNVLSRFAPQQEIYSIDECFLDVTGIPDLDSHGHRIRQAVWQGWAFPPVWAWVQQDAGQAGQPRGQEAAGVERRV
jgi:nucleotidyltransferase/DNA polymerase involved in DNA repair